MHCGAPRGPEPVRVQLCVGFLLSQLSVPRAWYVAGKTTVILYNSQHTNKDNIRYPPVRCGCGVHEIRRDVRQQQSYLLLHGRSAPSRFSFIFTPAAPHAPPRGGARSAAAARPRPARGEPRERAR